MSTSNDDTMYILVNRPDQGQLEVVSKALEEAFVEASKALETEKDPAVRAQWHNVRCNAVAAQILLER